MHFLGGLLVLAQGSAPLVARATVALPNTPQQVWDALASEQMWSWMPVIDNLRLSRLERSSLC